MSRTRSSCSFGLNTNHISLFLQSVINVWVLALFLFRSPKHHPLPSLPSLTHFIYLQKSVIISSWSLCGVSKAQRVHWEVLDSMGQNPLRTHLTHLVHTVEDRDFGVGFRIRGLDDATVYIYIVHSPTPPPFFFETRFRIWDWLSILRL